MKIELTPNEISTLIGWAEEATKGRFGLGDDAAGLTWEDEMLIKKLKEAHLKSKNG